MYSGELAKNLSGKRILFFVKKGEIFLHEHRHILLALQGAGAEISLIAQRASKPRKEKTKAKTKEKTKAKRQELPTGLPTGLLPELLKDLPISELDFSDHGINPLAELRALRQALRVFREQRPHIVIAYTIKPILYSALASRLAKLSRLPNFPDLLSDFWVLFSLRSFSFSSLLSLTYIVSRIKEDAEEEDLDEEDSNNSFRLIAFFTGLGRAFMSRSIFHRALSSLLCFLLRDATQLWVLNEHNRNRLRHRLPPHRAERVLLSNDMGIDLSRFGGKSKSKSQSNGKSESQTTIRFLFLSRLLRAKGVGEYLEAARLLRHKNDSSRSGASLEFLLAGDYAPNDPDSFPLEIIAHAHKHGDICWLERGGNGRRAGRLAGIKREDVASLLETVDCLVLPTYAEGLPRVILEAAAMEVPSIVARYAGWQRVVSGADDSAPPPSLPSAITCACRDSEDLARAMLHFSQLPLHERRSMGLVAREYAALHFSQETACDFYLSSLSRAAAEIA